MANIIVAFPKMEDAKFIRSLLQKNGYMVQGAVSSASAAIALANELESGVIVCGNRFMDMGHRELLELLPHGFQMLLVASRQALAQNQGENVVSLAMPIKMQELLSTVGMLTGHTRRPAKPEKQKPLKRTEEQKKLLQEAKQMLMERNNLTEDEAHRYIQKISMDAGRSAVETAQMLLSMRDM